MLRDLNDDNDRLPAQPRSLGRLQIPTEILDLTDDSGISTSSTGGGGYGDSGYTTPYVEVAPAGNEGTSYGDVTPATSSTTSTPDPTWAEVLPTPPRVMSPDVQQTMVPQWDITTGTSTCTTCTSEGDLVVASAPVASQAVPTKVTPLPAAPTTTNWFLIAGGIGLAWYFLRGAAPGLGNAPEDQRPAPAPAPPTVQTLGRPPRKPAPKLRQLDSLKIS